MQGDLTCTQFPRAFFRGASLTPPREPSLCQWIVHELTRMATACLLPLLAQLRGQYLLQAVRNALLLEHVEGLQAIQNRLVKHLTATPIPSSSGYRDRLGPGPGLGTCNAPQVLACPRNPVFRSHCGRSWLAAAPPQKVVQQAHVCTIDVRLARGIR